MQLSANSVDALPPSHVEQSLPAVASNYKDRHECGKRQRVVFEHPSRTQGIESTDPRMFHGSEEAQPKRLCNGYVPVDVAAWQAAREDATAAGSALSAISSLRSLPSHLVGSPPLSAAKLTSVDHSAPLSGGLHVDRDFSNLSSDSSASTVTDPTTTNPHGPTASSSSTVPHWRTSDAVSALDAANRSLELQVKELRARLHKQENDICSLQHCVGQVVAIINSQWMGGLATNSSHIS